MRKTKIICTLGPAVDNPDILEKLMLAGMDVARINFSHGNYEEQQDRIERVKEVRKRVNKPIISIIKTSILTTTTKIPTLTLLASIIIITVVGTVLSYHR